MLSKIPLINKTQVDENLITTGEHLEQTGEERTVRIMNKIFTGDTEFVKPFIENIQTVNVLYNEPMEILVDKEILYIKNS